MSTETEAAGDRKTYRVWLAWPPFRDGKVEVVTVDIEASNLEEAESTALDLADFLTRKGICGYGASPGRPEIYRTVLLGPNGEYLSPFDD